LLCLNDRLVQVLIGSNCSLFNSSPVWHHFDALSDLSTVAVKLLYQIQCSRQNRQSYAYAKDRLGILRSLEEFCAASVEKIAVVTIESVVKLVSIFGQV
jgi:hypothetical protein